MPNYKTKYKIGDCVGNFKILEIYKNKYNRLRKYKVQCIKCGKILYRKTIYELLKYTKNNDCSKHNNREDRILKPGTIIGDKYKVLRVSGRQKTGLYLYDFECLDCGFIKTNSPARKLKKCKTCKHRVTRSNYSWKSEKLNNCYKSMIRRCYYKKHKSYYNYGGRGINVCDEWYNKKDPYNAKKSFENWAYANGYKDGLTLNRIDPNGNYCPENCNWVTKSYNSSHDKRSIKLLTIDNETYSVSNWSRKLFGNKHHLSVWIRHHGGYYNNIEIPIYIHNKMVELGISHTVLWVDQTYMSYESWDVNCMWPLGTSYRYMIEHNETDIVLLIMNRLEELGLKNVVGFTE